MKSSAATDALVALEDRAPDFLFEQLPDCGVAVWPLLRWPLTSLTANAELGTESVPRRLTRGRYLARTARDHLPSTQDVRSISRTREVLFVTSGTTTSQTPEGRRNWLIDDFAEALGENAVSLQDLEYRARGPERPTYLRTFSFQPAESRADLRSKLRPLSAADTAATRAVIDEAVRQLGLPLPTDRIERLTRQLLFRLPRVRPLVDEMERALDRVQPRLAVVLGASYGGRSPMVALMKQRGIRVAEPQHGWIGPSHGAYNFGAAAADPRLSRFLPDDLLTFGTFWSDRIRFPASTVPIGKPHLDRARETSLEGGQRRTVLVVSSVSETEAVTDLTLAIRAGLDDDWEVQLRPHPLERATVVERYPRLAATSGVTFDLTPDVYHSLGRTAAVIGTASTVLYEALALGVAVFVRDSVLSDLYLDPALFPERIAGEDDIARLISTVRSGELRQRAPSMDHVFAPDAVGAFTEYVNSVV